MTDKTLSLMTYNIHKGFGVGHIRFSLPKMKNAIVNFHPDFLFLQEVQGAHAQRQKRIQAWPDTPQFEYLAENLWPHYVYAKNAVYHSGHHGNAILSKYPLETSESINLSNISRASRGILHAQVYINGVTLHLLCVHLGLFQAERLEQSRALMKRINDVVPKHEPLLMAGDFNDWRMLLSTPLFEELDIKEAFLSNDGAHARTFPALKPALCVDRVYCRGIHVKSVQCLDGKPWHLLSDHLPLYIQFTLE